MTKTEIWENLNSLQNTLIQAHVQLSNTFAMLESLKERLHEDIATEKPRNEQAP